MGKMDDEWKNKLAPEEYAVLRKQGTEAPFSGAYVYTKDKGMYRCRACGAELFSSDAKFDSGTGWPSFTEPAHRENVELREDASRGMRRTEVLCKRCGSHLGHVFDDGPVDKGGKRFCINSICLAFEKDDKRPLQNSSSSRTRAISREPRTDEEGVLGQSTPTRTG